MRASDITVDEMWNKFKSVLLDGISKYIPRGRPTARVANVKKNFQPFTAELRTLIHKKHRLWNRWISSRNDIRIIKLLVIKLNQKWQSC